MVMMEYYVYVYLDPRNKGNFTYGEYEFEYEPFYVGKGCGRRDVSHISRAKNDKFTKNYHLINKIRKILGVNLQPIVIRINDGLSEVNSCGLEIDLISLIGRLDLKSGFLVNLTDGGEFGLNKSDETLKKLSLAKKGENNPRYGYKETDEEKSKRVNSIKDYYKNNEHFMLGKTYDEIHGVEKSIEILNKLKGRESPMKGKSHKESSKIFMSLAKIGENNPNKGGLSEEHKEKIRQSNLGWKHTPETIKKLKEIQRQSRPKRKNKYSFKDPRGNEFIVFGKSEYSEFIINNSLSERLIKCKVNCGVITLGDIKIIRKSNKNTIGWEVMKIKYNEIED